MEKTKTTFRQLHEANLRIKELEYIANDLLVVVKHYVKNHDYVLITNAEKVLNRK